jgi:hypothetical protein
MKSHSNQKLFSTRARLLALLTFVPFVWSCSSLKPSRMVPQTSAVSTTKIGGSVRVMDVIGGRETYFGGAQMIDNEQFKKALILALRQSGLFNEVSSDHGEMDLHATIRSQDQKISRGLQYTATMVVTYKFVDRTGNTVWSAAYDSEFSSTAFAGGIRTVRAREGSARENLTSLMQGLREQWPKG